MPLRAGSSIRGPRRLLLAVAILAAAGASSAPAGAACRAPHPGVVNVSRTPDKGEGEESLSVNPLDASDVVVGSNQVQPLTPSVPGLSLQGLVDTAVWTSRDGGCSWRGGRLDQGGLGNFPNPLYGIFPGVPPEFEDLANVISADQHSVWDRHGNLYYESGQLEGLANGGDEWIRVWRSTDAGRSWGRPVLAVSRLHDPPPPDSEFQPQLPPLDRPWLAVDNSGGRRDGSLYVTWETSPFTEGLPPEVYERSSSDHGKTWGPVHRVDDGTYATQFNPRQFPVVDAHGVLDVIYDTAPPTVTVLPGGQLGTIQLRLARSEDGGRTFRRSVIDPDVHRVESPDEALPQYVETIPALAADPVHRGRLAVAWPQALGTSNSRILLRYTLDGGRTWSPRVDVADDPASVPDQHDHATVAYAPDGRLVVMWRDRRYGGGAFGDRFDVWARVLIPDAAGRLQLGKTFRLTSASQAPTTGKRGGGEPSEFLGLSASGRAISASWDQFAGALPDNVYRRIALPRGELPDHHADARARALPAQAGEGR